MLCLQSLLLGLSCVTLIRVARSPQLEWVNYPARRSQSRRWLDGVIRAVILVAGNTDHLMTSGKRPIITPS